MRDVWCFVLRLRTTPQDVPGSGFWMLDGRWSLLPLDAGCLKLEDGNVNDKIENGLRNENFFHIRFVNLEQPRILGPIIMDGR
jgi:hypothetical protein